MQRASARVICGKGSDRWLHFSTLYCPLLHHACPMQVMCRPPAPSDPVRVRVQAQVHQRNIQNVAAQHVAAAQAQAQETARVGQQKAAELARNVRAHHFSLLLHLLNGYCASSQDAYVVLHVLAVLHVGTKMGTLSWCMDKYVCIIIFASRGGDLAKVAWRWAVHEASS